MHAAYRGTFTALLALALTGGSAVAAPGDTPLSGPAAAIAKARAAADKAEGRAAESDRESEEVLGEGAATTPTDEAPAPATATSGGVGAKASPPAKAAPQDKAPPADEAESQEPSRGSYEATAHRDPFRPPQLNGTANARTPLETYQLGQLKLVGVVAQPTDGYRAMVEDSAGLGYIITTGTPIGSSGGVVRSIEPRRVVIEESTRDFYGEVRPKEVVMELPQEDRSP